MQASTPKDTAPPPTRRTRGAQLPSSQDSASRSDGGASNTFTAWLIGIGTILGGVGTFAALFLHNQPTAPPASVSWNSNNPKSDDETGRPAAGSTPPAPTHKGETGPGPKAQTPTVDYKEKYIDTSVQPAKGKPNFSIVVRVPLASQINTLEGAVQRALRKRGDSVIPLFREQFSKDDLDLKLFGGNASLAQRLELRKYCDRVLLGVVRFSGPPQNQNQSGLYMREAILDLHAIAAGTGEVLDDLEISGMGRGLDADSSTADALQKLEENVEEKISGWSRI